jgi:hypothetical protein
LRQGTVRSRALEREASGDWCVAPARRRYSAATAARAAILVRIAWANAANSFAEGWSLSTQYSGCHWTPIAKPGASTTRTASIVPIRRGSLDGEAVSEAADRLPVQRIDLDGASTEHLGQRPVGGDRHVLADGKAGVLIVGDGSAAVLTPFALISAQAGIQPSATTGLREEAGRFSGGATTGGSRLRGGLWRRGRRSRSRAPCRR